MDLFRKMPRVAILLVICVLLWALGPAVTAADAGVLEEVKNYVNLFYVDPVPPEVLEAGDVTEALAALGDPYSEYFAPEAYRSFLESISGHYGGVGMSLEEKDGQIVVVTSFPGSPARTAGITGGERILAVDGWEVAGWSLEEVSARIRGEPGTKVELLVEVAGAPRRVTLTRQLISLPGASGKMLDDATGYLQLTSFYPETPSQVEEILEEFQREGYRGLILDLRGNPGGLLESVLEVSRYFLPAGAVVRVVSQGGKEEVLEGPGGDSLNVPLVVLVDRGTASAAEILAGAIQDYQVGPVVGTRTFGKGSVQTLLELSNGGALKLTTARYLTPRGREVNGRGLDPDYRVEETAAQMAKARELLNAQLVRLVTMIPGRPEAVVGGEKVALEAPSFLQAGRTYVPLEFLSRGLGAVVDWKLPDSRAVVSYGATVVEIVAGADAMQVNGRREPLDAPALLLRDRIYVPLRAVAEAMGARVIWEEESQMVKISR